MGVLHFGQFSSSALSPQLLLPSHLIAIGIGPHQHINVASVKRKKNDISTPYPVQW